MEETKNPFVVGPQAYDEYFLGRETELRELRNSIFDNVGAVNLVGPARIGKSSLVSECIRRGGDCVNRLVILMCLSEYRNSRDFWFDLTYRLREAVEDAGLWNKEFERRYGRVDRINPESANWYEELKTPLLSALKCVGKAGWRLVLAIDEFDAVQLLFGDESYYYQLLRSIYSNPDCFTSGVVISRRRLSEFEVSCPHIPSFHGVFREMFLLPFSEGDMEIFYQRLESCGVKVSSGGRKRLEYFTGQRPYLCCMFARTLVAQRDTLSEFGDKTINAVHTSCLPQIDRHYDDIIQGIREDNCLELIFYLSVDVRPPIATQRCYETLQSIGILCYEEKSSRYYAFSWDFMEYFSTFPLKLPVWDTISAAEKRIKGIFKQEFPGLAAVNYQDLLGSNAGKIWSEVNQRYPELQLNRDTINTYCQDLLSHKAEPTLLDVLSLGKVISVIDKAWETRFAKYFGNDSAWRKKLLVIKKLRNPIAHAQIEYIDEKELSLCLNYCEELIRIK